MQAKEVYEVAQEKGIKHIYHANSLTTSISFLKLNSLASRKHVANSGLAQTSQYTDNSDKDLNVWDDIFLDTVDIHKRASSRNHYGPILFTFSLEAILSATGALVTKTNPSKWKTSTKIQDRYFTNIRELESEWDVGNFDQMITLQISSGSIPLEKNLLRILIDDPATGEAPSREFIRAQETILKFTDRPIIRRQCNSSCKCKKDYQESWILTKMFTV
ncbi:hypothetical protein SAMN05444506_11477 [Pseudomonas syringae]|uniref:hypothetical protein n=1 Tax=Pseudomonas syringae group TaxID=136849 RepID=UPI00089BE72D|nr:MULTISPECIES: hypothetical protein [Pseudomonas syringae group]SDZ30718.1 hypothetical protein SAMN05444506_11477 [Pseudomonas syringae]